LGDDALIEELEASCLQLAEDDKAGRGWAKEHGYQGYTSYASLNDLSIRDPAFADLKRLLDRHVAKFADACGFELGGKKLKLDSLWVNVLERQAAGHSRARASAQRRSLGPSISHCRRDRADCGSRIRGCR
jgi:uncharacterized protein (TIGR02466 family)